ncbi:leukocyte receptor cluster member 1 homolog isoform X1 [Dermacentor variabilis]|uniref:leukocyte receptor cluster member 1 homolog isoform X1 n=1 Tax=Dermacentor variabilis TaxID=34621 RepID=UPI003F5B4DE2
MNILPKKSWHVRTKRNIDRVRKDEALAAQEEKELQRRIQLAESEARINFLRGKLKGEGQEQFDFEKAATAEVATDLTSGGHFNFFKDMEKAERNLHAKNEDREKEKKTEVEEYEKKIGLLTYLGQSSSEASGSKPWFTESHEERLQLHDESEKETKDCKTKDRMDPLHLMKHYVSLKCGLKENGQKIKKLNQLAQQTELHSKKVKRLEKPLEQLRAERLAREKAERARAEDVLRRARGELPVREVLPDVVLDDRRRGYNSQYNPHLAKRPQ